MLGRGLAADGTIAREGALERVPAAFAPVVAAARARLLPFLDDGRAHSAYLYGSVPRGTATPGVSDLDLLLVLGHRPTEADRAAADAVEAAINAAFAQVNGVGLLIDSVDEVLSERERHDLGFFVACLCTPLLGPDLAERLPRHRPGSLLARETNGDLGPALLRWRERAAGTATDAERRALARSVARKLVRTGFTLVMPRWGGWTSDLQRSARLFGHYYPERLDQMRLAAETARHPTADPAVLRVLTEDLAPWLAAEYADRHGHKAPRP
ncbi:nucleotidyltransferase domain-containing protein [Streptomyces profundus]|nr:nucleotidyltransferase domain-containing protein [Streptomyces sp. MA3_2.13]